MFDVDDVTSMIRRGSIASFILLSSRTASVIAAAGLVSALMVDVPSAQQPAPRFGGSYAGLGERRQHLVSDWVSRFNKTTGQSLAAGPFYDEFLRLSTRTTFDAVTQALMASRLTDASGASMGDALALVERLDTVKGEIPGSAGDGQFRIYARLTPEARATLERSREFKRRADNSVFHKGYPLNYRAEGGAPSIQISMALDGRQADIDVDYRSSGFPVALFNGHLTAANSDVRAGDNADRHAARWAGFQNWWRSFFGVRLETATGPPEKSSALAVPRVPRAGRQPIEVMVQDFLQAWLVEGDVVAALGSVSERAYACLAEDSSDPSAFDRGMAPYQLMVGLKAARDTLGPHGSLEGLTTGVRLALPALKVVQQPHHAQFVIYQVPDDVAAAFDCESRLMSGRTEKGARTYGNYFGSTFNVTGGRNQRVALLWGKEDDYWKIVSWKTGIDDGDAPRTTPTPPVKLAHIKADASLVDATRSFLEAWLIRKDYDAAFRYLSPKTYACYDLMKAPEAPASTSPEDGGRKILAGMQRTGQHVGPARSLEEILSAPEPVHPTARVMDHAYSRVFTLTSIPNALGDAVECAASGLEQPASRPPLEYGQAFVSILRFRTSGGDAAVLRLLWRKDQGVWKITSYAVDTP